MLKATMLAVLILATTSAAYADAVRNAVVEAQRAGPTQPSKTVSKVRQPVGTPHKASSFAPHPTGKRVYGAPIPAPIVHNSPPPK